MLGPGSGTSRSSCEPVWFLLRSNTRTNSTSLSHRAQSCHLRACASPHPADQYVRSNPGLFEPPGSARAWLQRPSDARTAQWVRARVGIRTGPTWRTVRSFCVFWESSSGNRSRCQTSWPRTPTVHEGGRLGLRPPPPPRHGPCGPSGPDIRGGPAL